MSGELGRRDSNGWCKCVSRRALAFLAISCAGFSAHVDRAHTQNRECAQLSNLPDEGSPLAAGLKVLASKKIDAAQAEAACRSALRAEPSNPTFMFLLGRALFLGSKPLEAIKYYLDAADRGHADAMNDLAEMFEYGVGVPKNFPTALEWYERAAKFGHAGAMTHMAELSEAGIEVPQDFANARDWYEKAAALGNATSMNNLADLYRYGRGVAINLPAAANLYLKAAKVGLATAMNSLGELSEAGTGVPQSYQTAKNWYKKAADLGHADAMGNLGALFEKGRGGPQSLDTAREWYVKGAALNSAVAMHNLGTMFENGRGTSKNLAKAKLWYERAGALKYAPALNDLGRLYLAGTGVPKNYVRAKTSFEQAANLGNAKAMNDLGMLYFNGTGVQRDLNLARSWFERAIALNNTEAKENLKHLEETPLIDAAQVAARRASCVQVCTTLHRSYVNSVCGHYSAIADNGQPERIKCVRVSTTLAEPCRSSCREWARTLLGENKCVTCFQAVIDCSVRQQATDISDIPYAVPKDCLTALADCTAGCRAQTGVKSGPPDANREKLK